MRFATRYRHQISAEFLDILANLGISGRGREGIVRLMIEFNRLQLDTYEQGLMSAICATSADRGVIDKFDYAVLSATQVIKKTIFAFTILLSLFCFHLNYKTWTY